MAPKLRTIQRKPSAMVVPPASKKAKHEEEEEAEEEAEPKQEEEQEQEDEEQDSKQEQPKGKQTLDSKIGEFQKIMGPNPDTALLRKHFSAAELSGVWQRLKVARNKSDMSVKEAWQALIDLPQRQDKSSRKLATLWSFLQNPKSSEWKSTLLREVHAIQKEKTVGKKAKVYYRGELNQLHGESEAEEFIESGKFQATVDEQGTVCYIKNVHYQHEKNTESTRAEVERHRKASTDEAEKFTKSFGEWFQDQGSDIFSVRKKPSIANKSSSSAGASSSAAGELMQVEQPQDSKSKTIGAAKKCITMMNKVAMTSLDYSVRCKGGALAKPTKMALQKASTEAESISKNLMRLIGKKNPDPKDLKAQMMQAAKLSASTKMLYKNKGFFAKKSG